jgi:hypothetical protein
VKEVEPHYVAGSGIRPPRRDGKYRGVAREIVPGGGLELWACDHDHAPGVRSCQLVTEAQRAEAEQCAVAWLARQIVDGFIVSWPVLTETQDEERQAADAIVIPVPDGADPVQVLEDMFRAPWPGGPGDG